MTVTVNPFPTEGDLGGRAEVGVELPEYRLLVGHEVREAAWACAYTAAGTERARDELQAHLHQSANVEVGRRLEEWGLHEGVPAGMERHTAMMQEQTRRIHALVAGRAAAVHDPAEARGREEEVDEWEEAAVVARTAAGLADKIALMVRGPLRRARAKLRGARLRKRDNTAWVAVDATAGELMAQAQATSSLIAYMEELRGAVAPRHSGSVAAASSEAQAVPLAVLRRRAVQLHATGWYGGAGADGGTRREEGAAGSSR